MMNSELITRLSVPPKPEEIFDGDTLAQVGHPGPEADGDAREPHAQHTQQISCIEDQPAEAVRASRR